MFLRSRRFAHRLSRATLAMAHGPRPRQIGAASCDAQVILAALVALLAAHCLLLGAAFTNWAGSSAADDAGRSEN